MSENSVPVSEKFTLTIKEASDYFRVGVQIGSL